MINSNQLQSDISAFLGNSTCNLRLEKSEERVYGYSKSFLLPYIIRAVDQGSYIKDRRLAGLSECFSIKRPDMENHKQQTLPITLKFQKLQTIFHFFPEPRSKNNPQSFLNFRKKRFSTNKQNVRTKKMSIQQICSTLS